MAFKRGKIDTFGKPYIHVGWHDGERPKFTKKSHEQLSKELDTVGLDPTYDNTGWFTGTIKKEPPMPVVAEGIPDHMIDAYPTPSFGNPCSEIMMTQSKDRSNRSGPSGSIFIYDGSGFKVMPENSDKSRRTVLGHPIYCGPASTIEVVNEPDEFYVKIKQHRCIMECEVRFGPVKTTLSKLFDDGHWLEISFTRADVMLHGSERQSKVYLTDGTDRYKVYSTNWQSMQSNGKRFGQYDLGDGFTGRENMMKTHSSARYPKPVIQIVERLVERDPFEVLAERYPRGKKRKMTMDTMVGNRTLGERLQDHFPNQG